MFLPSIPSKQNRNFFFFFCKQRDPQTWVGSQHHMKRCFIYFSFTRWNYSGFSRQGVVGGSAISSETNQTTCVSSLLFSEFLYLPYLAFLVGCCKNVPGFKMTLLISSGGGYSSLWPLSPHPGTVDVCCFPAPSCWLAVTSLCSWSEFVKMKCKWVAGVRRGLL